MKVFQLTHEQRKLFAEKLLDFANLDAGALVVGQLISDQPFSLFLCIAGVLSTLSLYTLAYFLSRV